jgi:DNA primase
MAKQLPDEFLKQIRDIPIEEIAETYFDLKNMGNIYQTNCIHKGDNSPSLTFFTQTNTFYCFGCGAGKRPKTEGADVISFIMWVDNCSFMEAVTKIAGMRGMEVPKAQLSPEEKKRQEQIQLMTDMNRRMWEDLQKEPRALKYLKSRGIGKAEIDQWRIGYIPEDTKHFHKGKITFALMNESGQTVGFSHRDMTKEFYKKELQGPKYVNSAKSVIFDKGSILYGLNFIKKRIREKGYVVVGEGFGDTILGQKAAVPFVSMMGTSLTDNHIRLLKRHTDVVILWMDGDQAGIEATIRHAKALQKEGLLVKILNVRDKDPDDVFMEMLKDKRDACEWIEENAVLASQFEIQKIMMTHMSRMNELIMNTIKAVKPIAMSIPEGDERDVFLSQIAHQLHIPLETLIGSEKNERAKV